MRQILNADYDQILLLPPAVEDWIGADHPARFIREFVTALDLQAMKLDTLSREEGGVAYHPRLLLSAWLLGHMRKVRSTRALERACREEMGFVWLTGNHRPDHHALWRFWNAHRDGIRELVRQSVRVALQMNLVGLVAQALDGTKIMAAAGSGSFNQAHLEKLLKQLDDELDQRECDIAQAGDTGGPTLPDALQQSANLREQVRAALARVQSGECKHAHPKEPEAARMECDGRNRFGYNAQAVVDAQAQIVLASDVIANPSDHDQLVPMIAAAQQTCEPTEAAPVTLADGGYANGAQLSAAVAAGYEVLTPLPSSWSDTSNPFHAAHFQHQPERKIVVCPQGRELPLERLRQKEGRTVEVYRSRSVCHGCPVRSQCTSDRHGRMIEIQPGRDTLVALHARWQKPETAQQYAVRVATVEPVFAQIKNGMGFRRWTVRGLEKVRTQWALLCTTWNLAVIYRHWRRDRGARPGKPMRPVPPRLVAGASARALSMPRRAAASALMQPAFA